MRKVNFLGLLLSAVMVLTSCGGGNSNISSKSVDVPPYALANGSIYGEKLPYVNCYTVVGKISNILGYSDFGEITTSLGYRSLKGMSVRVIDENSEYGFVILGTKGDIASKEASEDNYTLHAIVHKTNPNNGFSSNIGGDYCSEYFWVNDEELSDAIQTFQSFERQPNQPSQFSTDTIPGAKTYNGKILKSVLYYGYKYEYPYPESSVKSFRVKMFCSLYLDCGAVVLIDNKKVDISPFYEKKSLERRSIDCIVSADNRVIEYKWVIRDE